MSDRRSTNACSQVKSAAGQDHILSARHPLVRFPSPTGSFAPSITSLGHEAEQVRRSTRASAERTQLSYNRRWIDCLTASNSPFEKGPQSHYGRPTLPMRSDIVSYQTETPTSSTLLSMPTNTLILVYHLGAGHPPSYSTSLPGLCTGCWSNDLLPYRTTWTISLAQPTGRPKRLSRFSSPSHKPSDYQSKIRSWNTGTLWRSSASW